MNRTNISVVDDSPDVVSVIRMEFKDDQDYKIKYFTTETAGVSFLADLSKDDDLVVLDINIPDFDIIQAVKYIDKVSPMAYTIIISGDKDFGQLVELTNMGIFRFCEKDGIDFLKNLREYIAAAHHKIATRKEFIKNLEGNRDAEL